ncbi:hypothetical protein MSAS_06800 [Mycobacterium saskatchewanense]|nr:hypothetical protein MSAS_06800 [Mycobacterium saskatchewanense]
MANAASYAAAADDAWAEVCSAFTPVRVIHSMYGETAAAMVVDAGPSQPSPTSPEITV